MSETPQVNIDPVFTVCDLLNPTTSGLTWQFNGDEIRQDGDAFWIIKGDELVALIPPGMLVYRNDAIVNEPTPSPVTA